jgi:hypothetical protein
MKSRPPLLMLVLFFCCGAAERPQSVPASAPPVPANWAFHSLARPPLPTSPPLPHPTPNPIDAFIHAKLFQQQLQPSSEANRRTLLRRVYFDLVGLPPTPEEMRAFLADTSANAFERVVDRLLASPRYGERWARHWMDSVHFAETHGHDQDRIRTNAWPYRDYLIASFNADKPYARFVQEQVAGDVLFPDDPRATIALGFIAAGPWDESSLRDIREDTIDRQIGRYLDRDDMVTTVMQSFTSTTVQCARCHDHKFDPISQRDYYALQAVFAGVDRANRIIDLDSAIFRQRQALLRDRKRLERGDRELLLAATTQRQVAEWQRSFGERKAQWQIIEPQTFVSAGGATLTRQTDGSLLVAGPRPERDTYTITANPLIPTVTAVRLEVLTHDSLPHHGPGRQENGNLHLSEFQVLAFVPGEAKPRDVPLVSASADFNQSGWTIEHALDSNEKTAWGIHPKVGEPHQAVFELKQPLTLPKDTIFAFVLKQLHGDGHLIGRPRFSVTDAQPPVRARVLPADIDQILAIPAPQRSDDQRVGVAAFYLREKINGELAALPKPSLVYAAASDFEADGGLKPAGTPRPVQMLKRGDINQPLELAVPGALTALSMLPARFELTDGSDEGARRAALARWLTHSDNPLTWRSVVNRQWQHHFGRGLVETPNDFGKMGGLPSHPELLDWLATWFRDQARGSLKQLHRLIVTSATYRQTSNQALVVPRSTASLTRSKKEWDAVPVLRSSAATEDAERVPTPHSTVVSPAQLDSDNRLLWRMNRTRLDAEQVRDTILQISDCLDLRMGGPSDRQFDLQPGTHVTPKVDYTNFNVDSPAARRRSVYRFLFRTLPDPLMDALDCPAGDQLTPVRNASVTVQQALALWNNAFVAHYAARFAARLQSMANAPELQVSLACELAFGRPPTPEEQADLTAYMQKHGLANLCRLIFNSNEFMFLN